MICACVCAFIMGSNRVEQECEKGEDGDDGRAGQEKRTSSKKKQTSRQRICLGFPFSSSPSVSLFFLLSYLVSRSPGNEAAPFGVSRDIEVEVSPLAWRMHFDDSKRERERERKR